MGSNPGYLLESLLQLKKSKNDLLLADLLFYQPWLKCQISNKA
jgi:hypothetical protein